MHTQRHVLFDHVQYLQDMQELEDITVFFNGTMGRTRISDIVKFSVFFEAIIHGFHTLENKVSMHSFSTEQLLYFMVVLSQSLIYRLTIGLIFDA